MYSCNLTLTRKKFHVTIQIYIGAETPSKPLVHHLMLTIYFLTVASYILYSLGISVATPTYYINLSRVPPASICFTIIYMFLIFVNMPVTSLKMSLFYYWCYHLNFPMHCILTWRQVRLHTLVQELWCTLWEVLHYRGLHMDFADLDSSLFSTFEYIYLSYVYFPLFLSISNDSRARETEVRYKTQQT